MEVAVSLAENLKRLREERNISLGQLAKESGVSKVTLSQIEKGEKHNPTIQTIWKIANALKVPYTALIEAPKEEVTLVTYGQAHKNVQKTQDETCSIYCYFPCTPMCNFEFCGMDLEVNASYESPGFKGKAQEYVFVKQGNLKVSIGKNEYILNAGDSLHFFSDKPHVYRNVGDSMVKAVIMNDYEG